jgi:hypothetical protein
MARREFSEGITFRDFAALAKLTGWMAEDLAREFPGIAASDGGFSGETSETYFGRVLNGRPGWGAVIPYRRVIEKYLREARLLIAAGKLRSCVCGCGSPVFSSHQRFAHDYAEGRASGLGPLRPLSGTPDDGEANTPVKDDDQYAAAADGRVGV